jgi:hypothetical protein
VTLILSGGIAALLGFCTSPWQLVALRGLTGLVHFGGFMSVIGLGEIVDEESRNEGTWCGMVQGLTSSFLVACWRKRNRLNAWVGHWWVFLRAIRASPGIINHEAVPAIPVRRSWTAALWDHNLG